MSSVVPAPAAVPPAPAVALWRLDLQDPGLDPTDLFGWLTPAERARAERGVPLVRRRRVLMRAALRRVLGGLLHVEPGAVVIGSDRGRPVVPGSGLEVSCSASGAVGLVAVTAGARLGVDVEAHDDRGAQAAADEGWLTLGEQAGLAELPDAERLTATTRCWTQKEAVLKARGVGLAEPPSSVETPLRPAGRVGDWWVDAVPVPAGHLASVAVETPHADAAVLVDALVLRGAA